MVFASFFFFLLFYSFCASFPTGIILIGKRRTGFPAFHLGRCDFLLPGWMRCSTFGNRRGNLQVELLTDVKRYWHVKVCRVRVLLTSFLNPLMASSRIVQLRTVMEWQFERGERKRKENLWTGVRESIAGPTGTSVVDVIPSFTHWFWSACKVPFFSREGGVKNWVVRGNAARRC